MSGKLIDNLVKFKVIQKGEFTLKSGKKSDLYFDLRKLYGVPKGLDNVCLFLWDLVTEEFDLICGVPLGAVPFVTNMSVQKDVPMIILRKERKEYGGKKLIEGTYKKGQRVLLVEDVVTTGSSIKDSEEKLKEAGLEVVQKIVIVNRSSDLYDALLTEQNIREHLNIPKNMIDRKFENELATRLWKIMLDKRTNICLSADVETGEDVCDLLEKLGDHICMIKIHWDTINFSCLFSTDKIYILAERKNVLILDDRKYADIDSIVRKQVQKSKRSHAVTAHSIFGQGTIDGIKDRGIFLIAQSSAKGNLIDGKYSFNTETLAVQNKDSVAGFISQGFINNNFLHLTPGIHLEKEGEGMQGYMTPQKAVAGGSDVLIIGRGIYHAEDPLEACLKYREQGWKALVSRFS